MYKHRITVFTPTYNRAYIIHNLYESLKNQTFKDFEWLVVDDGSVDNTKELFDKWKNEKNDFVIRYYKTPNGGKHRAINKGLELSEGELFFTVDSDDTLTADALEKVDGWFKGIEDKPEICGIVANRGYSATETINHFFKAEYLDKTLLDVYSYKENGNLVLSGERAYIFYTDFHRKYLYPEFEGENFMTEAVTWNRMSNDGYMVRFYNDIIWIFEYLEDGLTKGGGRAIVIGNPMGYGLWLREKAEFEKKSFFEKLKMYAIYTNDLYGVHPAKVIAKSIGAPVWLIKFFEISHRIKKNLLNA